MQPLVVDLYGENPTRQTRRPLRGHHRAPTVTTARDPVSLAVAIKKPPLGRSCFAGQQHLTTVAIHVDRASHGHHHDDGEKNLKIAHFDLRSFAEFHAVILGIEMRSWSVLCMCDGRNHRPMYAMNPTQTRKGGWVATIPDRQWDAMQHQGFICRKNACTYS